MKIVKDKPVDQAKPRVNKEVNEKMQKLREKKVDPILWTPKEGENYFYITGNGEVWADNNCDSNGSLSIGNTYQTRREAKQALKRQKAIVAVNRYIAEKNDGWVAEKTTEDARFNIYYSLYEKKFLRIAGGEGFMTYVLTNARAPETMDGVTEKFEDELKLIFGIDE